MPPVSPSSPLWALNQLLVSRSRVMVTCSMRPESKAAFRSRCYLTASGNSSSVDLALAQYLSAIDMEGRVLGSYPSSIAHRAIFSEPSTRRRRFLIRVG